MPVAIGLDCGGTATRWVAITQTGEEQASGTGPGLSGLLFTPEEKQEFHQILADLCATILQTGIKPDAAAAGVTGMSDNSPEAKLFNEALAKGLGLPAEKCGTYDDARVTYLSAFDPGEGILVYGGTGSFAYHLQSNGNIVRAGGCGAVIDDGGSGYWIGSQALKWLVRRNEGVPPLAPSILVQELYQHIGGRDWADIRRFAYSDTRANVASLTRPVASAATAGDPDAKVILQQAADELVRLVGSIVAHVGEKAVSLTGGVSVIPLLHQHFTEEIALLCPGSAGVFGQRRPPANAAANLALALKRKER